MQLPTIPATNLSMSLQFAERCLRDEAQAILDLIPQLDNNFIRAVDLMYHCHGKVIVTGVGKSGHIGQKIAATLASTGTPAFLSTLSMHTMAISA